MSGREEVGSLGSVGEKGEEGEIGVDMVRSGGSTAVTAQTTQRPRAKCVPNGHCLCFFALVSNTLCFSGPKYENS